MENNNRIVIKLNEKKVCFICVVLFFILFIVTHVIAMPVSPTITVLKNTTKLNAPGTMINSTINGSISPGGFIFTISLNSRQQNLRWKAFVGNVTGTFVLEDSAQYALYEWTVASIAGEVYATRSSTPINWSRINCSWVGEGVTGYNESNRTIEELENKALNHTSPDDNITATFTYVNHSQMVIGGVVIGKDECFSIHTWQKGAAQSYNDSDNANFTQLILYDGTNTTNGAVVYATEIETNNVGYNSLETYDFQMLLPENSKVGFSGSTPYYFFVELS